VLSSVVRVLKAAKSGMRDPENKNGCRDKITRRMIAVIGCDGGNFGFALHGVAVMVAQRQQT
tara:strand:- start:820 stop:1005 length:186 start_codon:yes stop_codon:yes gene_type:complete